jgi:hypothetical protein
MATSSQHPQVSSNFPKKELVFIVAQIIQIHIYPVREISQKNRIARFGGKARQVLLAPNSFF